MEMKGGSPESRIDTQQFLGEVDVISRTTAGNWQSSKGQGEEL